MSYERHQIHRRWSEWTDDRIEILRRLYPTRTSVESIASKLGLDEDTVRYKARKLGLYRPNMGPTKVWTDKQEETLQRLWKEGKSASYIASILKVTRNSVIGKIHRMKIGRPEPAGNKSRRASAQRRHRAQRSRFERRIEPVAPPIPKSLPLPPESKSDMARKKLADLEKGDCRFPVGDPKNTDFGFCADERLPGSSYCHRHTLRAFQLPKVPERVAAHIQEDIQVESETQREKETV